jgi:20S proteasome subunit beta 2
MALFSNMEATLGFDFSLFARNESLGSKGLKPRFRSTGTTVAGLVFDGGVVLGADTRATDGSTVCTKAEAKIHSISDNIWCCGAGTAADNDSIARLCSAKLRLFQLNTGLQPRVEQAVTFLVNKLFPYGGHLSAALIVGGVDFKGPSIFSVSPDGCAFQCPFRSTGSGSLAAYSVLEAGWRPRLTLDEAKELVANAIEAGITNDLGSGSDVNLCIITPKGSTFLKRYRVTSERPFRIADPVTAIPIEVLKETAKPIAPPEIDFDILQAGLPH